MLLDIIWILYQPTIKLNWNLNEYCLKYFDDLTYKKTVAK